MLLVAGIGKAIARRLAQQGLNVVIIALQNDELDKTFDELQEDFPHLQFRKVGCNTAPETLLATDPAGWCTIN